jgi:hypothetical protein
MRRAWIGVAVLVGFFMLAMFLLADAEAQTASPTGTNAGAYDRLSPGNQKIADALFESQQTSTAPGAPTPLSRDDIAAMKLGGKGWGVVFKNMKEQGLVTDKNLGQAVSRYNYEHHSPPPSAGGTQITTASGRTYVVGGHGHGNAGASGRGVTGEDSDHGGASSGATGSSGRGGSSAGRGAGAGNGHGK